MADTTEAITTATAGRRSKPVRHYHHGRSPAAWTGVVLASIGFLLAAIAAVTGPNWVLAIVGGVLIVLSLVVSGILKAAGFGNG